MNNEKYYQWKLLQDLHPRTFKLGFEKEFLKRRKKLRAARTKVWKFDTYKAKNKLWPDAAAFKITILQEQERQAEREFVEWTLIRLNHTKGCKEDIIKRRLLEKYWKVLFPGRHYSTMEPLPLP